MGRLGADPMPPAEGPYLLCRDDRKRVGRGLFAVVRVLSAFVPERCVLGGVTLIAAR